MSRKLTGGQVRALWSKMASRYGSGIIRKEDSQGMVAIGQALDLIGIMDQETFLRDYTTTVGKDVFVNFRIGEEDEGKRGLISQVTTCAHEFQHVHQYDRGGMGFQLAYLASRPSRAVYELEAMQVGQEVYYWLTGSIPDPRKSAEKLAAYGLNAGDVDFVEEGLESSAKALSTGARWRIVASQVIGILEKLGVK